ncbi:hypothetical protein [Aeropyrum camini]|uniref:hypothetical protein n=1 Tax=Aeropyrum camini TaxID=229980 RepID=UPI0011E58EF1|nr:hypothetical protein [Aeropyrum camini]
MAACLAEVELLAQVRLLRALLVFYRDRLPGDVREALARALEEAEAVLDSLAADPVVRRLGDRVLENRPGNPG